ncbi:carboxylesterase [Legionella geestiana]|uniref:Carboxylesterase n=1 Tax=Legionella geestiana TaxID=45065 RepID=A0A0W0U5L3_9GAMM|nr:alpha/beta fold hydrolase [Legionella geestiana]KTD03200.1 carboxylesterase [Legionella geestiana]QBS12229.1 alpha/beta fold hydrolase [Legionella geestiana]QDQ40059.1 alpha/beta fold hydrolase [Legionella geestiana]STX53038.1 carboxylesterase [Legionella geestiana]
MKINDFRWMRQGLSLEYPTRSDLNFLRPINEKKSGTSKALLMLHGFSSSPAVFRCLIPELPEFDALMAPLLPGHGESISAFADSDAAAWIAASEASVESLLETYDEVHVLGLSLGGLLAVHLGQRYPLHHLWLLAPALAINLPTNLLLPTAKFLQKLGFVRLRARSGNICRQGVCELTYRQLPIGTICEIMELIRDFPDALPTCPTDIFLGRHDMVVNSEAVAARFMDAPNTTLHWLKNSAHVLPLDNDFREIAACIRAHVGAHETA